MPVLELRNVSRNFGPIQALIEVDFDNDPGEMVGLMGDNGAGKSTLVKVIAGDFPPSCGKIVLERVEAHFSMPPDARDRGIDVVYQDLALCDDIGVKLAKLAQAQQPNADTRRAQ